MNYFDKEELQQFLNQKYNNAFTILDWQIDDTLSQAEMNWCDKSTGQHWKVSIPVDIDYDSFIPDYFRQKFQEIRDSKIKKIIG